MIMKTLPRPLLINLLLLLAAALLSVAVGAVFIPPATLLQMIFHRPGDLGVVPWPEAFEVIFFKIRLPHMVLIALTGAALAGSGAAYQGLFRNPLADPYLIGVASGAGLGAVFAMVLQEQGILKGLYGIPIAAFIGALGTIAFVSILAFSSRSSSTTTLILAGVAVSSFATALTSYLMLRSQGEVRRSLSWLLGGATMSGWEPVLAMLFYVVVGLGVLATTGHALNVLQFGEEQAAQLGLSVRRARIIIIVAASLTTAAAISFSGIIGFIGLIVPHTIRFIWGTDYRRLISLSILAGATTLLFADVLARLLLAPQELPVGIITALAGAPFFLWILRRYQKNVG
jgi:iron complex transport system permease protein